MTVRTGPSGESQQTTLQAIRDHHRRLGEAMEDHVAAIGRAIDEGSSPAGPQTRLVAFCADELLPHATAEEETLYAAGARRPETRLLVHAMSREHLILRDLVGALEKAPTPGAAAGTAGALNTLFHEHLEKENDLLLPALVDAGIDLRALLAGMHEILGDH